MSRRKTTEEFIKEAKDVWGDKFDYSQVDYKNGRTKVIIICEEHGEVKQAPIVHLRSDFGCPPCSIQYRNRQKTSKTTKEFIQESRQLFGDNLDYSKVQYINAHTNVVFICRKHGEFKQTPTTHLNSKYACTTCANLAKKETNLENFLKTLSPKKKKRFSYKDSEYKGINCNIEIECNKHGKFITRAAYHKDTKSGGCKGCRVYNINGWTYEDWILTSKKSKRFTSFKLYIIKMVDQNGTEFFKIGRTFLKMSRRHYHTPYDIEIIDIIVEEEPRKICKLEINLQALCKNYSYLPQKQFPGMHECFSSIDPIIKFLE